MSVLAAYSAAKHTQEPRDYKEALQIPHWRDPMEAKFFALQNNGTWQRSEERRVGKECLL